MAVGQTQDTLIDLPTVGRTRGKWWTGRAPGFDPSSTLQGRRLHWREWPLAECARVAHRP